MDNFDLKQYLTEGRLHENTGEIKLDGSVMMGGDWETGLEDNEIEFVNQNILHQPTISAKDFLDAHGQLWTMMKEPGGDSDVIEGGLIDHVQMGILSVDDAVQVMAMYWGEGGDIDEEDLENYRSTFTQATLKEVKTDKYGNHLEPQFQVGEKVTYLGYPAEIVKIKTEMDGGITYSLYYDKGNGKTKVTNIKSKGGAIKAVKEIVTHDFEERIDQIVNHYFKGDQEVKKAAVEYASLKAARTMGGRSATASYFKDFFNNYSSEVANQAMEVIDMADDDAYINERNSELK